MLSRSLRLPSIRSAQSVRLASSVAKFNGQKQSNGNYIVNLVEGDGIGPEIAQSVKDIYKAAKVPIDWDPVDVTPSLVEGRTTLPSDTVEKINKNKVALKGPLATPVGKGHQSLNLTLRKTFNLFANCRPAVSVKGYETAYKDVDTVLIRENTEGEYAGLEHEIVPGVVQSIKLITRDASSRVAKYAFEYARSIGRKKVCVVHKATLMKYGDGLFLESVYDVGKNYPDVEIATEIIDNACLKMVKDPGLYKDCVMVMPNLYGDIMSDLASGLIGGLGLTPSGNMGTEVSIFEAVHGSAPDIAGQGKANPTALLLSSVMMLRHMELNDHANRVEKAVMDTLASGKENITGDLGGSASTQKFTDQVISRL